MPKYRVTHYAAQMWVVADEYGFPVRRHMEVVAFTSRETAEQCLSLMQEAYEQGADNLKNTLRIALGFEALS